MLLTLFVSRVFGVIPTKPHHSPYLFEAFNDNSWTESWSTSTLSNVSGKWEVRDTAEPKGYPDEKMIFMTTENSYYGLSTEFKTPLKIVDQTLVLQYEVRLQDKLECGGAYIKLFSSEWPKFDPTTLCNESKYVIMFGPDKCGDTNKVHFIFRHRNLKTGLIEEKHMNDPPSIKDDKIAHLYTLIVRPDNTFEVLIDGKSEKSGDLLNDFTPSVNPPKTIDDPNDFKPSDWVDEEFIDDPDAKKPDDWDESLPEFIPDPEKADPPEGWLVDEPHFIPDPNAQMPNDWDEDIHGEWEAPTIPNPKCETAPGCGEYEAPLVANPDFKGKWIAPQIDNPAYKGEWSPRQIPNPNYYEDPHPHNFAPIVGAGFELWMVNKDIGFGNILIDTDEKAVRKWNDEHFLPKFKYESDNAPKEEESDTTNNFNDDENKPKPPEKKARPPPDNLQESMIRFITDIRDAFTALYEDNPASALLVIGLFVFVPSIIFAFACRAPPPPPPRRHRHKKRAPKKEEEKKEEEKKEEEKKETEETEKDDDKVKTE